jgi:hypothetical protein
MSEARTAAPSEREVQVLCIARAMRSCGFVLDGCINEDEARAAVKTLAGRGFVELSIENGGEVARITSAGAKFLRLLEGRGE